MKTMIAATIAALTVLAGGPAQADPPKPSDIHVRTVCNSGGKLRVIVTGKAPIIYWTLEESASLRLNGRIAFVTDSDLWAVTVPGYPQRDPNANQCRRVKHG